jgi:16S rRNA (cytosine1402-N4)-methyltransferase
MSELKSTASGYHIPVMLQECIEGLAIRPDGVYVDATFGGGGHSRAILAQLNEHGRLLAFDQDADAKNNLPDDPRLIFVHANFADMKSFLRVHGYREVDGILADLGVSSHQFDTPERGFSFRFDAPLDMRMNQSEEKTAATILNTYNAESLQDMFSQYGEVRNSKTLAEAIFAYKMTRPIRTINDLLGVLRPLIRGEEHKYLAQVFQAIRIEVNQEMQVLETFLMATKEVLKPEGRLVVLTFHSLEDRPVKNFFKTGNCAGEVIQDFYGNIERPFDLINKKVIEATREEQRINSRSRSAKLRIAAMKG